MTKLPNHPLSNGPTTPGSHSQSFDGSTYFNTVTPEILHFPVTRLAESSLDPWLIAGPASPGSSTLSMSPSQDIVTPPSEEFYDAPYPEQLPLPAYQFLEQLQPLCCGYTSHPIWKNTSEEWRRNYAASELWNAQPFVAQPWITNQSESYTSPVMSNDLAYADNGSNSLYLYAAQIPCPVLETDQASAAAGSGGSPPSVSGGEESSEDDSDWNEDESNPDKSGTLRSRSKPRTRTSRPHVERWPIPVNSIQQSETRGYRCNMPDCASTFLRPEHLRRHYRSKHTGERNFKCEVPDCQTPGFSRGDNMREHYWTHLERGGRNGKNQKFTLEQLRDILGPSNKKLYRRLRVKHRQHMEKEILKKRRIARPAFVVKSKL